MDICTNSQTFRDSSPLPNMYDTSISESSTGRTSHGYPQQKQEQHRPSQSAATLSRRPYANPESIKPQQQPQQQQRQQRQHHHHHCHSHSDAIEGAKSSNISPLHQSSTRESWISRSSRNLRPRTYESVLDISDHVSIPSAPAPYATFQQPHRESPERRTRDHQQHRHNDIFENCSTGSDNRQHHMITAPPTSAHATQSEPGVVSFDHHSHITDLYSASVALSPARHRLSSQNRGQQFSNRNLEGSRQHHSASVANRYELAHQQRFIKGATTSSAADRKPFPLPERQPWTKKADSPARPLESAAPESSPAICYAHRAGSAFPDPELIMEEESDAPEHEHQHEQLSHKQNQQPLPPFYHPSRGRPWHTDATAATALADSSAPRLVHGTQYNEVVATAREASHSARYSIGNGHANNSNFSSRSQQEFCHTSSSSNLRPGYDFEGNKNMFGGALVSTNLPPVRRRMPLQQPACNPGRSNGWHHQQQQQAKPSQTNSPCSQSLVQEATQNVTSPSRYQYLNSDHKIDYSQGISESHHLEEVSSSPPTQQQNWHSAISKARNQELEKDNRHSNIIACSVSGGFKPKFYEAAIAAKQGERPTTVVQEISQNFNTRISSSKLAREAIPSTTVRSQAAKLVERRTPLTDCPPPRRFSAQETQHQLLSKQVTMQAAATTEPMATQYQPAQHASLLSANLAAGVGEDNRTPVEALQRPTSTLETHQLDQLHQHRQPQQTSPQGALRSAHSTIVQKGELSSTLIESRNQYISKLLEKLNSVSRDDPQAALEQIDSILRTEERSGSASKNTTMVHHKGMLQNVDPVAVENLPQLQSQEGAQSRTTIGQDQPYFLGGDRHNRNQLHHSHPESPNVLCREYENENDNEGPSDDDTSVSTITNPTYRSSQPTHEHLHDVPPSRRISTSGYRGSRPNGIQNYTTRAQTRAIAGLELVQRHHQRRTTKTGHFVNYRPGHNQTTHHAAQEAYQRPPTMINVTSGVGGADNEDSTNNNFTENLMNSASKKEQCRILTHPKCESGVSPIIPKEGQPLDASDEKCLSTNQSDDSYCRERAPVAMTENVSRKLITDVQIDRTCAKTRESSSDRQQTQTRPLPGSGSIKMKQSYPYGKGQLSSCSKQTSATLFVTQNEQKSTNPFDDAIDAGQAHQILPVNQHCPTSSTSQKARLDLYMSRKKEDQIIQRGLPEPGEAQHPSSFGKVCKFQVCEAPTSKSIANSSGDICGSSRGSTAGSLAPEMAAVSLAATKSSLATVSSFSEKAKKSYPRDQETGDYNIVIDFRETSMDDALGVEAGCFSQSQMFVQDLRGTARMHHNHEQWQAHEGIAQVQADVSPMREIREVEPDNISMQKYPSGMSGAQQESALLSQHEKVTGTKGLYVDVAQETGFEVTPIYAIEQRINTMHVAKDSNAHWVELPSNPYFEAARRSQSKVVATLVDEDKHPVTMVRSPELPTNVADAFARVPLPNSDPSVRHRSSSLNRSGSTGNVVDVSELHEGPPPTPAGSHTTGRGRRAFANFLRKKAKGSTKPDSVLYEPRATPKALNNENVRGRSANETPDEARNRARSLDDTNRIKNPNIAKKFSRLLKVYGNDIN